MKSKHIDLTELMESEKSERVAERLSGALSETEERVWGDDFAASGSPKGPPPAPPTPPAPGV